MNESTKGERPVTQTTATATATGCFYRPFTREQSSAIANLHLELQGEADAFVEVIFHSSERAYGYWASPAFAEHLLSIMGSPDLLGLSLGRVIAQARKDGSLSPVETNSEGL